MRLAMPGSTSQSCRVFCPAKPLVSSPILGLTLVYVDRTGIILPLVREKGRYFLSRPRRFGKSLLVDAFKELFEGNEPLFHGLAIHDSWDWSESCR